MSEHSRDFNDYSIHSIQFKNLEKQLFVFLKRFFIDKSIFLYIFASTGNI